MAFNLQNLAKWSVSMNTQANAKFGYNGAPLPVNDTLATILTDGYFNDVATTHLKLLDVMSITGTDGVVTAQVIALSPDVILKESIGSGIAVIAFIPQIILNTTPVTQVVAVSGVLPTDFIFAQTNNLTGGSVVIIRAITGVDNFTIQFSVEPVQSIDFSALIVRLV